MKINLYSVYDEVSLLYSQPFCALNDAVAMRMFYNLVHTEGTDVHLHYSDYSLYRLGVFDDHLGSLHMPDPHLVLIITGAVAHAHNSDQPKTDAE